MHNIQVTFDIKGDDIKQIALLSSIMLNMSKTAGGPITGNEVIGAVLGNDGTVAKTEEPEEPEKIDTDDANVVVNRFAEFRRAYKNTKKRVSESFVNGILSDNGITILPGQGKLLASVPEALYSTLIKRFLTSDTAEEDAFTATTIDPKAGTVKSDDDEFEENFIEAMADELDDTEESAPIDPDKVIKALKAGVKEYDRDTIKELMATYKCKNLADVSKLSNGKLLQIMTDLDDLGEIA